MFNSLTEAIMQTALAVLFAIGYLALLFLGLPYLHHWLAGNP